METINLLQKLNEERKVLADTVKAQEEALGEKLFTFFKTISEYNGLEMMPLDCDIRKPWCLDEEKNIFEVQLAIRFFNEKGELWPSGQPKADFGSDISLYIFDDHIKMNYGTCGDYTRKNKGQMTRALLVPKLWENEDTICSIAKASINMNDYDELMKVRMQIDRIENDIKTAQREREREETLEKIRKAKFICKRRKADDGHWDDKGHYFVDRRFYVYHSFEKIKKVTDKSVLTTDEYWRNNHRHDLNLIINGILQGSLFLQTERIDTEDIPMEGTPTA